MTSATNKHPLSTAVHFFKIVFRTSLAHGIFNLPKEFAKQYGNGMSNPVYLKPPDDIEWEICWSKHDGEIWFQKGWKEFATYYSLAHGHLLFFEYDGTSHFDVHIFNSSALEIHYPSHGTHGAKTNPVEISDDSVDTLDKPSFCQKSRVKATVPFPRAYQKMKNSKISNGKISSNGVNLHQEDKIMKQTVDEDENNSILNGECKGEQLTSPALNKGTTFRTEYPSFRLAMNQSFVNDGYSLEIPQHFAEKYLKKTRAVVTLQISDGRSWPVIYSAPRLTVGWSKFASENNLNVRDICVFELMEKIQGLRFKVSIFQGAEEPNSPDSLGESSSQRTSKIESRFKLKILATRAFESANKFRSENPFFIISLTQKVATNITRHMHVPLNFARKYFANMNQKMMMIQFRKKLWPVKFVFVSTCRFSTGWSSFVRDNKLQRGDVCVFELVNREDATLDAHVFRGYDKIIS